jgi:hypothetical protein
VTALSVFQHSVGTYRGIIKISLTEILNCYILTDFSTTVRAIEYTNRVLSLEMRAYVEGTVLFFRQTLEINLGHPVRKHRQSECLVKAEWTLVQTLRLCTGRKAHRGRRGITLPSLDHGGEGSASSPGRSLPPGKSRYPLHRRLGGHQDRSGQVRKFSPSTGIRSPYRPARSQSLNRETA